MLLICPLHQMIRCSPVAMTIEQRANDTAIQNSVERFVFLLRFPFGNHFAIFWKTADMQSFGVRRTAAPAGIIRRVFFLKRLFHSSGVVSAAAVTNRSHSLQS